MKSPYAHELNGGGTACEDGTSSAGAAPCPACALTDYADLSCDAEVADTLGWPK